MIIVAGFLSVEPTDRSAYLDGCRSVIEAARAASGCLDFSLSPDPIDPARINVFEAWEDVESVEAFRGSGTDDDQLSMITAADVRQYEVRSVTNLTG